MLRHDIKNTYCKSLPSKEFTNYVNGDDSGVDSASSISSTCSTTTISESEITLPVEETVNPLSFIKTESHSSKERIHGLNNALQWIKTELQKLKEGDKTLTKTFIRVRSDIAECQRAVDDGEFGYDSENDLNDLEKPAEKKYLQTKDKTFPADGTCFENNKRATWVI